MSIIIEGPDLVGKTTFARLLSELGSLNYVHQGKPTGHEDTRYYCNVMRNTVYDRWHLGMEAYGQMGLSPSLPRPSRHMICTTLFRTSLVVVLYAGDVDWLARRYNERGDELYGWAEIAGANAVYAAISRHRLQYCHLRWDSSEGYPGEDFARTVLDYAIVDGKL